MIRQILLDLDGVCNRLIMHALEANGCGVSRYDDEAYPLKGDYDIVKAANHFLPYDITAVEFWGKVTRKVWANTPPSEEFDDLLDACVERVGIRNVYFLTAPTDYPDSAAGKMEWIQRYAPGCMRRQFQIGHAKELCARADKLLIDDSDANVAAFRAEGGQAVLMPRPWNARHAERPGVAIDEVRFPFAWFRTCGLMPRYTRSMI